MKINKKLLGNLAWIIVILLFLFTPIQWHFKVFTGKLLAGDATVVEEGSRVELVDYRWELVDMQNIPYQFEKTKGKVVFVNFWATWCPPCIAELPSISRLYEEYKDEVEFVFVTNDKKEKVQRLLTKKGYDFPVYFENSRTPDLLLSKSIPTTYIISKNGKIAVKEKGSAQWDSQTTKELLNSLLAE